MDLDIRTRSNENSRSNENDDRISASIVNVMTWIILLHSASLTVFQPLL